MSTLIFDLESDGFLHSLTTIHCLCIQDFDTKEIEVYYESKAQVKEGLTRLYDADRIVGHNIIGYDIPAIQKIYPRWTYRSLDDTFLLSCILNPLRASHSIESYSGGLKVKNEDWSCLTYNMVDRCVIDTILTTKIYTDFLSKIDGYEEAIKLEYQVAINHQRQVRAGVDVDVELVHHTIDCLDQELEALRWCINKYLPKRMVKGKGDYKKVFKKDGKLQSYVKEYFNGEVESGINPDTN